MEDMLRACVLTYGKDWEKSLTYAEFSYNNSYQASLDMSPFEALYGRKCRTPLMWSKVGERTLLGAALTKEAEDRVDEIREKLKEAQSRQKSYSDKKKARVKFCSWRFCVCQSLSYSRNSKVPSQRQASTSVYWTISSITEDWSSSPIMFGYL